MIQVKQPGVKGCTSKSETPSSDLKNDQIEEKKDMIQVEQPGVKGCTSKSESPSSELKNDQIEEKKDMIQVEEDTIEDPKIDDAIEQGALFDKDIVVQPTIDGTNEIEMSTNDNEKKEEMVLDDSGVDGSPLIKLQTKMTFSKFLKISTEMLHTSRE